MRAGYGTWDLDVGARTGRAWHPGLADQSRIGKACQTLLTSGDPCGHGVFPVLASWRAWFGLAAGQGDTPKFSRPYQRTGRYPLCSGPAAAADVADSTVQLSTVLPTRSPSRPQPTPSFIEQAVAKPHTQLHVPEYTPSHRNTQAPCAAGPRLRCRLNSAEDRGPPCVPGSTSLGQAKPAR